MFLVIAMLCNLHTDRCAPKVVPVPVNEITCEIRGQQVYLDWTHDNEEFGPEFYRFDGYSCRPASEKDA